MLNKNKNGLLKNTSTKVLLAFICIALLAPLIANHKPLYIKYKGHSLFPAFSNRTVIFIGDGSLNYESIDFRQLETDLTIFTLVPYSPGKSDFLNIYASPFGRQYTMSLEGTPSPLPLRWKHWLGTNGLGADVLAGIIYGFRNSLFIAFTAVLVASLIGILLGSLAGYFGNNKLRITRSKLILILLAGCYILFFLSNKIKISGNEGSADYFFQAMILVFVFVIVHFILTLLMKKFKIRLFTKKSAVPVDHLVSRMIEVLVAMPRLILIITLAAIIRPSFTNLAIILGISLWTEIARFTRAQTLKLREMDFVTAARALGFSNKRILFRHLLINGMGPVLVVICFSFSNIILTESALSFLGVGVPPQSVTWGSIMSSGRENFDAWWLTVFPGCCIVTTVLMLNSIADHYYQQGTEKI